jgi:Protein of unknown function (DUF3025)
MVLVHRRGWDADFGRLSPWFWPLAPAAAHFADFASWPQRGDLERMYRALVGERAGEPLRFVENVRKQDKSDGQQVRVDRLYDARISLQGEVPTREQDWHDFFNALCFATFPLAKRALHRRQYRALSERIQPGMKRLPPSRTPEQDSLTLFDEGGAVIAAEAAVHAQLMASESGARPECLRSAVAAGRARVIPFGHALFEHLVEGLRCPGGSTRILALADTRGPDRELLDAVDRALSAELSDPSAFRTPREGAHMRLAATLELSAELVL